MLSALCRKPALRWLVGVGVPLLALAIAALFFGMGKTPPCVFYEITGLYCAGCGAGRAMLALLRGELYAAFRYQPLLIVSLPFLAYCVAKPYLAFVLGRDILPMPRIRSRWFGITVTVVIVAYWILRNIPLVPFSYLAPASL